MQAAPDRARRMIGIVGGVGPYAGIDLAWKVLDQTVAARDQEHLPLVLLSVPERIADRTEFLLGRTPDNPARVITEVILQLERLGASVIGIPCNTAHSPPIFEAIRAGLRSAGSKVGLVHMIDEVARFLGEQFPRVRRVGVLCTTGTYRTRVYPDCLAGHGLEVLVPDEDVQERAVQRAIYDPEWGIKARPHPVTGAARKLLDEALEHLRRAGAEAIVLGCTEIPLAVGEAAVGATPIVDANLVLARALVRQACPEKLKPFSRAGKPATTREP